MQGGVYSAERRARHVPNDGRPAAFTLSALVQKIILDITVTI